ncbi:ABC transporter substrate-binding protein [Catenovulum sp. 2E275]|uniref:ABC transporter substrate-binding protein n=1 Tax=Catenovulum sp. 2E275 TaxID=2980497 RepID=UPI0021D104C6|nr:ABC transporter substrate-binding protein [Catenovulum sp. 2E275]MCU4676737.1 ABC transporter substrate-binding protein [Catenovulum sp. 2E275]
MIKLDIKHCWLISVSLFYLTGCDLAGLASKPKPDPRLQDGLVYCSEGNPENFNPQTTTSSITLDASARQVYDRLINYNSTTQEFEPGLATSWQTSDDGLTVDLFLRQDVAFHHTSYFKPTRSFNADDVIFSFNRWRLKSHPFHDVAPDYPFVQTQQLNLLIDDITALSPYHVQIKLVQPSSSFITQLTTDYMVILSAEYGHYLNLVDKKEQIDVLPVGTGPFYFAQYIPDEYIRFKAHPNYWDGKSKLDQLIFDITPKSSTRLAKLVTGECDVIAYPIASEMEILQDKAGITLQSRNAENIAFWAFNTLKPPFDKPEVRRALTRAIDLQTILKTVYYGMAFPAKSVIPPSSWGFNPNLTLYDYNPELAKKELEAAGIKAGFEMEIWAPHIERAYNPNSLKMAELIKANLAAVGIRVNIVDYEWTTLRKKLAAKEHDSVLIGWSADIPDPDNYLRPILSCTSAILGNNRAGWCNPEFDTLLIKAQLSENRETRKDLYFQAQSILNQQVPIVPIAHSMSFLAKQDNVFKVNFSAFSAISFRETEKL